MAALVCLATFWFDRNRRLTHYFASAWSYHYMMVNPNWKVHFEGVEQIDSSKTYVIVANHQSLIDILVLYGLFKPFKWVSKESIFKVPFIGWNMIINQYVTIRRGDIKSIKEMIQSCRDWLNRGASILIFPEGTRSEDGEIHDFRDGSFRLAAECNVPVVPVVIDGTFPILPKHAKLINYHAVVRIKVLPPIAPQDFDNKAAALRNHVHALMVQTLAEMRAQTKPALSASTAN